MANLKHCYRGAAVIYLKHCYRDAVVVYLKHCYRGAAVVYLKHCYRGAAVVYLKHCYRGRVVTLRPQSCNPQTRPQKSYFKTLLPQYRSRSTAVVSFYHSRASVNYLQRIQILYH